MRAFVWLSVLFVSAMGVLWLGGESWFAWQARQMISDQPSLVANEVRPLRDPRRLGIRIGQPEFEDEVMSLSLPWADLWISPLRPQEARLTLPDHGQLRIGARQHDLSVQAAEGRVRQSLFGGPMTRADLQVDGLALDGQRVLDGLDLQIRAARLTDEAPDGAVAAYDATVTLQDLSRDALLPPSIPRLSTEGKLSLQGGVRLWSDQKVTVQNLGAPEAPRLMGARIDDLILQLGDHRARIGGQLQPDAYGRAEGELTIRTENVQAILDAAFDSGLLPASSRLLVRPMMARLQRSTVDGEFGLSLVMENGQMKLGPVPLGPAPVFWN